jgi:ABC-type transporter Mla MlaB component
MLDLVPHVRKLRLKIENVEEAEGRTIALNGAATFVALPKLSETLESTPAGAPVRLDLSHCSAIDHSCAELLKDWLQRRRATGDHVELSGASGKLAVLAH